MSPTIAACIAVAIGSAVQAATGIGFGMVSAPYLIALLGPRNGVRTSIALSVIANVLIAGREPRGIRLKQASFIAVPAIIATFLLAVPIKRLNTDALSIAAGVSILLAVAALATGLRLRWLRGVPGGVATGFITAAMNLTSGVFSPPAAIYVVNAGWEPSTVRPTLQVVFITLNIAALANLGVPSISPLLPLSLLGGWILGASLSGRVKSRSLQRAVLVLAFAGGVLAILRGL